MVIFDYFTQFIIGIFLLVVVIPAFIVGIFEVFTASGVAVVTVFETGAVVTIFVVV